MIGNFVQETANAPGSAATVTLAGPAAGRRGIIAAFGGGATVYLGMDDGTQWQLVEALTVAGPPQQITITTVVNNSAGTTNRLNFTGSVRIYSILPAERNVYAHPTGNIVTPNSSGVQDGVRLGNTGAVSFVRIGSAINGEGTGEVAFDRSAGVLRLSTGNTGSALTERLSVSSDGTRASSGGTDGAQIGNTGAVSWVRLGGAATAEGVAELNYDRATGDVRISTGTVGSALTDRLRISASPSEIVVPIGSLRTHFASTPASGQIFLGNGTARLFYDGTKFDLNGPLDVNGTFDATALTEGGRAVAPRPTASSGVGEWVQIGNTLPSGGTWAYLSLGFSGGGAIAAHVAGVAAGGTTVLTGQTFYAGFAWRIA
jgi:hypothetical protein